MIYPYIGCVFKNSSLIYWFRNPHRISTQIRDTVLVATQYGNKEAIVSSVCHKLNKTVTKSVLFNVTTGDTGQIEIPKNNTKKEKINMENILEKILREGKETIVDAKNTVIIQKRGQVVLDSIRASLLKAPIPEQIKEIIKIDGWGDMIIASILRVAVPTINVSDFASDACKDAFTVSVMKVAEQTTWVSDIIKHALAEVKTTKDNEEIS